MSGTVSGAEGLTAAWLTAALAPLLDGGKVAAVRAEPVGTGQVSDSLRLHLTCDGPGGTPATMVAKVPAADPASRQAARTVRTYEVEAGFYRDLAPRLDASVPACHYVAYDGEHDDYVVLLEDLAPAVPGDQLAGMSAADAESAVVEMAALHAAGWNDPELAALGWLNRHDADTAAFTAAMVTELYAGFRERYAARLEPGTVDLIEEFLPRMGAYLAERSGAPTLVHGDFRADNLMFGGARASVLDWQTCAYGPGLSDLSYFLGSSLPVAVRREHERSLVGRYHSELTGRGVDLPWEDCWRDYRAHVFHGIVMAVGAAMLVERTDRGDAMFCAMTDRHARHARDLDSLELIA